MKKILPIAIVIVVALGVGAWWFLGRGSSSVSLPVGIEKESGEEGESFTGKLKQAVAMGVPLECTFEQGGVTGIGLIKGKNYYGEVTQGGRTAYVIMKGECMWSWSDEQNQGVKMCFEDDIFEEFEQGEQVQVPTDAEYYCSPAAFSDSKFNPPLNIDFMDMDQGFGIGE